MRIFTTLLCLFLLTFDVFADTLNSSEKVINDFISRILSQQPIANSQQPIITILDESLVQQPTANSQQPKTNSQMLLLSHLKTENLV